MPEIAVIMAAWLNTPQHVGWLSEAIASVRTQTFKDYELVIVDDASPVQVQPVMEFYDADYEQHVRHLRLPKHGGPAVARNIGAAYSRAPWLFCLDCDDKLKPDALGKLYAARDEARYVYGDLEFIGKREGFFAIREWNMDDLRRVAGPIGVTALQSRKLWKALGGWREDLDGLEDIEYWIRAAECGVTGKHVSGAIFEYRIHDASRTATFSAQPGRAKALADAVRQNHLPFLDNTPAAQPRKDTRMTGKVEIVYVGRKQGGFPLPRSPYNHDYRVDGLNAHFHVDALEVDWLMSFRENGQPMFRVHVPPPPPVIPPPPIVQPPADFESIVVESAVPRINEMNVREAVKALLGIDNVLDLNVAAAVENATQKRTTVLKAINERGHALIGANWGDVTFDG